jgi:hypothetical protein
MVRASHFEPGSGAVARLTVPYCTQRYTVRAWATGHMPANSNAAGNSQRMRKEDPWKPAASIRAV